MISAGNPAHFIPFGRNFINWSGEFSNEIRKNFLDETLIDESVTESTLAEKFKFRKIERFTNASENFEEIYFRGNSVILSKNGKALIKSFFLDFPVFDALWCDFPSDSNSLYSKQLPTVCFVGKQNLDVHTNSGEQISLKLPFEVSRVFETRQGLLLARLTPPADKQTISNDEDSPFPYLFSLSHPLNEVLPVLYKPTDKFGRSLPAKYTTNSSLNVLYVDVKHSVLFTFDSKINCHRLWVIRKASHEDALSAARCLEQSMVCGKTPSIVRSNMSLLTQLRDTPSASSSSNGTQQASDQQRTSSINQQSTAGTSSLSSGYLPHTLSPIYGLSPFVTPNSSNPMGIERTPRTLVNGNKFNSPAVSRLLGLIRQKTPTAVSSPLPSIATPSIRCTPRNTTKNRFLTPVLNGSTAPDITAMECSQYWPAEPLIPDVCLDHLWTEPLASKRLESSNDNKSSSKSFLVEDFVGHKYFCYFLKDVQQLKCLKLKCEEENVQVMQSNGEIIACKDVAVAVNSQITIVLDINFTLVLYSGVTKISFLHVNTGNLHTFGVNVLPGSEECSQGNSRIFSSSRAVSSTSSPLKHSFVDVDVSLSPVVSECRRDADTPLLGDLTPVGSQNMNGFIAGLDVFDVFSCSFLMRLMSPITCKITLPSLSCNPSVQLCLDALCSTLPKEKSMQICCQWYLTNNSPSSRQDKDMNFLLFTKFLADLIGFQTTNMKLFENLINCQTPSFVVSAKKVKCDEQGNDSDWEYVLNRRISTDVNGFSSNDLLKPAMTLVVDDTVNCVSNDGLLFNVLPSVFYVLHCCYEDLKLRKNCFNDLKTLCKLLHSISCVLKLTSYVDLYERNCSELIGSSPEAFIDEGDFKKFQYPFYWNSNSWTIFNNLKRIFEETDSPGPPVYIVSSCVRLWLIHVLYGLFFSLIKSGRDLDSLVKKIGSLNDYQMQIMKILDRTDLDNVGKLKEIFSFDIGRSSIDLTSLPCGVILPLFEIGEIFSYDKTSNYMKFNVETKVDAIQNELTTENEDGMNGLERNELLNMRFAQDLRVVDVRRMLRSSKQIKIHLKQQTGASDHDFREEQEHFLYSICLRTMTLPIGRGMFTLRTFEQLLTEHVGVPKLCLTGKSSTQNLTIELTHIETPPNMDLWPQFHNGVAAALRVKAPRNAPLNSAWIISNMPKTPTGVLQPENAGFLFGLGLNGHLTNLALFNIHEYLVKGDSMTSVAVLLGIAAAKCKSNDVTTMKMLATHVPFLLPPTLLELNVDPQIQNAAVVGVGLLCAESGNHRLAEALLREIGRPPTAQTDNFVDRESYALSCGLALGLVTLGRGNLTFGDPDFTLADELILLMNGGHKRPHHFSTNQTPSNIMKEGEFLNVHVTSTPATLALGMMYMKSNDAQAASWLNLPDTLTLLDTVRPDCLLIRTLSKSLIMWDDVAPSIYWVERQLAPVLHKYSALIVDQDLPWYRDVDFESISQAYCYVVAGACFSIGMKFAGSANAEAFAVLIHYCKAFFTPNQIGGGSIFGSLLQKAGKYTVETCLNVVVLSLGMVMASTGNLDVLRIIRKLRKRLLPGSNYLVPHMALGLLFLGGGRFCLKTDNLSLAVMLCAFFPKFPLNSNDNRYHLQALRHLYVLACEPRVFITKDEETGRIAYCNVRIYFKKTKNYPASSVLSKSPCPLPELHLLSELVVEDERYWPVRFVSNKNWNELKKIVFEEGALMIRRRAGFDSYKDDPLGYKSAIHDSSFKPIGTWSLDNEIRSNEVLINKFLSLRLFCVRHECLDALPFLIDLHESVSSSNLSTFDVWQLKLVCSYIENRKKFVENSSKIYRCVFSEEFILSLSTNLEEKLIAEIDTNDLKLYIGKWVSNVESGMKNFLGEFLTYFDVDSSDKFQFQLRDCRHLRSFVEKMQSSKMPINSIVTIQRILMR